MSVATTGSVLTRTTPYGDRVKPRLGERLLSAGVITQAELEAALGQQSHGQRKRPGAPY